MSLRELDTERRPVTMIRSLGLPVFLLVNASLSFAGLSQCQTVAVAAGQDGAALITRADGKKTRVQKDRGQVGISAAHTASDGTVGWLAEYSVEDVSYPIAGTLIIWRSGRTIRRFRTEQSFYTWTFYAGGKQVAYHVGPLHGEAKSHCELHDVESGRLIAVWDGDLESGSNRPAWTRGLSH
jgi:hypothetical protein